MKYTDKITMEFRSNGFSKFVDRKFLESILRGRDARYQLSLRSPDQARDRWVESPESVRNLIKSRIVGHSTVWSLYN